MSGVVSTGVALCGSPYAGSGFISLGYYAPVTLSGVVNQLSGYNLQWDYPLTVACGSIAPLVRCKVCDKAVPYTSFVRVQVGMHSRTYCLECAGFMSPNGFETREEWIRNTVPLPKDTPACVIADWLLDHSRYDDADYMRKRS